MNYFAIDYALKYKPNIKFDMINTGNMPWQVIFSYVKEVHRLNSPSLHTQDYHEIIIYVKSGRKYFMRNSIFEAEYGDFIIFPASEPHKSIDVREDVYERYYIYLNPALFDYLPDGGAYSSIFAANRPSLVKFDSPLRENLLAKFAQYKAVNSLTQTGLMKLRILIYEVLYELSVYKSPSFPTNEMPPLLAEIVKFINTDFASIPTSSSIAGRFGISESYLSRLFKLSLKISPYQYLQNVRIFEAKRLLQSGAGVTEACFASGFTDCSHFIKYFKRAVGVTPSVFKN